MASSTVVEFFGLKDKVSGDLVRLRDADCSYPCGEAYAMLTDDESEPYLQCADKAALDRVLLADTPSYNASPATPSWGRFKREQLVPVQVRTVLEVEEFEYRPALAVETLELREIPYSVAKGYAGQALPDLAKSEVVFWLVVLPEDCTLESALHYEGEVVYAGSRWSGRRLFKALPVPADYLDITKGKPAALFLASGLCL